MAMMTFVVHVLVLTALLQVLVAGPIPDAGIEIFPTATYFHCQDSDNYCATYCQSVSPAAVIHGKCGNDKTSCICTTDDNRSVKVRIIQEKVPLPPTERPIMTKAPVMTPEISLNGGQEAFMPQLLICDNSAHSIYICESFCRSILTSGGTCNTTDYTCVCSGVPLSVVQSVPISAIYTPELQYQHQTQQPWIPIPTQDFNQYNSQPGWGAGFPSHNEHVNQQHYLNPNYPISQADPLHIFAQPYSTAGTTEGQEQQISPLQGFQNMYPYQHTQNPQFNSFPQLQEMVTSSISEEHSESNINLPHQSTSQVTQPATFPSSIASRRRRSAGSSYLNALELQQSLKCSKSNCGTTCHKLGYRKPFCNPQCVENSCYCSCRPAVLDSPNHSRSAYQSLSDISHGFIPALAPAISSGNFGRPPALF